MRLFSAACTLLALTGLLLAARPSHGCSGYAGCSTPPTPAAVPAAGQRTVSEMVAILDKTESKDTFLIAVMTLHRMGGEAREALPAILRNAERLGLLQGVADGLCRKAKGKADSKVSAVAEEICDAMLDIAAGRQEQPAPVVTPACAPAIYAPVPATPVPVSAPQPTSVSPQPLGRVATPTATPLLP